LSERVSENLSILLLCNDSRRHAANVLDHIHALRADSRHTVQLFNPVGERTPHDLGLESFDVVVIHYTIVTILQSYFPSWLSEQVAEFGGLKVQFLQDEYRWIDEITSKIRSLGIDVVFTLAPPGEVPKIYGERTPGVQTVTTLAGFVPDYLVLERVPPLGERPIDVGYRGRTVPFWLGRLGQEKVEIGRGFRSRAATYGLTSDIAWGENDRIYGKAWNRFLASCRTTLGTESGASIADYDGSVERRVRDFLSNRPTASFEEVEKEVLEPFEGNLDIRVISPRQFEAAALRTTLVLFPGEYSGRLEPWRHYIPLEKDFSNMEDVVEHIRDAPFLEEMVARTYDEVARSEQNSLKTFVSEFDDLVSDHVPARAGANHRPRVRSRSRRRRVARALGDRAYATARLAATLALVVRRPRLRRLARAYAGEGAARRTVGASDLLDDLAKLGVIADAQTAARRREPPFYLEVRFDAATQRLVLGSMRGPAPLPLLPDREEIRGALTRGELEIVWNHAAIGDAVKIPVGMGRGILIPVGYHGVNGAHSFRALQILGRREPDLVFAALEPALG
jgi:hypothetical protein